MKNSPHLLLAQSPAVIQGRTIEVLCGAEIINAQPVPVWDEVVMGRKLDLEGTRICRDCRKLYAIEPEVEGRVTVFAILPGGEDATA